jgi:hypothetical protein
MTIELAEKDVRDGFSDITFDMPVSRIIGKAHRRRVRRRVAFAAVPTLGLLAAGGTALLSAKKVWGDSVFCFNSADPKDIPLGASSPQTTGERPEKLCAREWRNGYLSGNPESRPDGGDPKDPLPVPPLTACMVDGQSVGVFPTNDPDFCTTGPVARKMSLAEIPEDYDEYLESYMALRADATQRIRDAAVHAGDGEETACLDETGAREVVEGILVDHGHEDWTIRVEHNNTDAPCWTHINFENPTEEVVIYSTERGIHNIWINDAAAFPGGS